MDRYLEEGMGSYQWEAEEVGIARAEEGIEGAHCQGIQEEALMGDRRGAEAGKDCKGMGVASDEVGEQAGAPAEEEGMQSEEDAQEVFQEARIREA